MRIIVIFLLSSMLVFSSSGWASVDVGSVLIIEKRLPDTIAKKLMLSERLKIAQEFQDLQDKMYDLTNKVERAIDKMDKKMLTELDILLEQSDLSWKTRRDLEMLKEIIIERYH